MADRWLPVVGYEGRYEVSDDGRIRSIDRITGVKRKLRFKGRELRTFSHPKTGHLSVGLRTGDGQTKKVRVQRAVLIAFVGEPPAGHECCHRNGIPTDNRVENLYWGTRSDNMQDMLRHGRKPPLRDRCGKGHIFDEANTRICPDGSRACRACARELYRRRAVA
jgi:hypothetical protein